MTSATTEYNPQNRRNPGHTGLLDPLKFGAKLGESRDIVPEINDSGPMCITDLFQNKYINLFKPKIKYLPIVRKYFSPLQYVTF